MASAKETLERVLFLEQELGYADRAVIGGLELFLANWEKRALAESEATDESGWCSAVVKALAGYGRMSPQERKRAMAEALRLLPADPTASRQDKTPSSRPARKAAEHGKTQNPAGEAEGLDSPLIAMRGISKAYQERLGRLGLQTVRDLLYHLPHRYEDYTALKTISDLELGDEVTIVGTVREVKLERTRSGLQLVRVTLADDTGSIEARWFGQPYLAKQFRLGTEVVVSGKVDQYLGRLLLSSPEWEPLQRELLHTARLVPIYSLTAGVSARRLRSLIKAALDRYLPLVIDPLPQDVRNEAGLLPLTTALQQVHFPDDAESLRQARRRLSFDELFLLQLGLLRRRRRWQEQEAPAMAIPDEEVEAFLSSLPFDLTQAQRRALEAILADMASGTPMNRLLQGDVGSGKTVVAVGAILAAVHSGYQAAVMAPTGILAEQHFATIGELLAGYPDIRYELLVGRLAGSEKERIQHEATCGEIDLLIGTHALIQDSVRLPRLGLVVVDEQHRFGVLQRAALVQRGEFRPHMLAMSATPIPRSLAMTMYGDMDVSVLDELPPGRQKVITAVRDGRSRQRIYAFIDSQVREGHQVFVVCPRIGEATAAEDIRAATDEQQRLQGVFPHLRVGLLHGQMSEEDKDAVMSSFQRGECDILVSTTVIEVGIDIPNATVMLVENAERFGLAQLHQLRGRVGRGDSQSYCILMSEDSSPASLARLRAMEETNDGFALAELDLQLRGPGDLMGVRQHGIPLLKIASLADTATLELARRLALHLHQEDPDLSLPEHRILAQSLDRFWTPEATLS